ncbi:hypothetical protein Save01_07384 [Streptomyces avermitilis]
MPMMAIGSSAAAVPPWPLGESGTGAVSSSRWPSAAVRRRAATAAGVVWSKMSVTGNRRPVALLRRLRSSTPMTESKPRWAKLADGPASDAVRSFPSSFSTAMVWARTRSRSSDCCCVGDSAVRRAERTVVADVSPCPRSWARDVRKWSRVPWPRRSVPMITVSAVPVVSPRSAASSWRPMVSTGCGLISTNVLGPCCRSSRAAGSNRTVLDMLRYQYAASSSRVSRRPPVTEEWKGMREGRGVMGSRPLTTRSSMAYIRGEWAGTSTGIMRVRTCAAVRSATRSATASRAPETTVLRGPLTAATASRAGLSSVHGAIRGRSSSGVAATETSAPVPARVVCAWLQSVTTRAASARDRPPETWAAAISPRLCPSTAHGSTPCERQRAAREIMTANRVGWTTSTRSSPGASGESRNTCSTDQST